mmetsp:Transcript_6472/g.18066  ORF Transcript_6472/g.18066 Transcript_6472/m.18066 type:complete len:253 (+) Transcript_6472:303-1061(+)
MPTTARSVPGGGIFCGPHAWRPPGVVGSGCPAAELSTRKGCSRRVMAAHHAAESAVPTRQTLCQPSVGLSRSREADAAPEPSSAAMNVSHSASKIVPQGIDTWGGSWRNRSGNRSCKGCSSACWGSPSMSVNATCGRRVAGSGSRGSSSRSSSRLWLEAPDSRYSMWSAEIPAKSPRGLPLDPLPPNLASSPTAKVISVPKMASGGTATPPYFSGPRSLERRGSVSSGCTSGSPPWRSGYHSLHGSCTAGGG